MSDKKIVLLTASIGSIVGSYLPILWGASGFSFAAIIFGAVGGFVGIWVGWKLLG